MVTFLKVHSTKGAEAGFGPWSLASEEPLFCHHPAFTPLQSNAQSGALYVLFLEGLVQKQLWFSFHWEPLELQGTLNSEPSIPAPWRLGFPPSLRVGSRIPWSLAAAPHWPGIAGG